MMEYQIVSENSLDGLEVRVRKQMGGGWEPIGGVGSIRVQMTVYYQAMVKLKPDYGTLYGMDVVAEDEPPVRQALQEARDAIYDTWVKIDRMMERGSEGD